MILGSICFIAFCFLQRSAFPLHYRYRLVGSGVRAKGAAALRAAMARPRARAAARVMFPSSATATKYLKCRSSMCRNHT